MRAMLPRMRTHCHPPKKHEIAIFEAITSSLHAGPFLHPKFGPSYVGEMTTHGTGVIVEEKRIEGQ